MRNLSVELEAGSMRHVTISLGEFPDCTDPLERPRQRKMGR